jgi:small subunit ribosomal protein S21
MLVAVNNGDVDFALRVLKKKLQREGILKEWKLRRQYEKPSEKRTRERKEAIHRARKRARKKHLRESGTTPRETRGPANLIATLRH